VPWLFLLSGWLLAMLAVMWGYANWNRRGLTLHLRLHAIHPAPGSPADDLPEQLLRTAPLPAPVFEGDAAEIEVGLDSAGHAPRGPAWVSGSLAGQAVTFGTGLVSTQGWRRPVDTGALRRGPLTTGSWTVGAGDVLGLYQGRRVWPDAEVALVLPRFAQLAGRREVRELEASAAAPRAGSGNELFGVREYRSGDSLRRIHWRSSARRGELVVREYEPPGAETLAILCDPEPASVEVADQIARIAASETWDCIREGGRVVLWAPGLEPSQPSEARSFWALLEWLARYPSAPIHEADLAIGGEVVAVTTGDPRVVDALEMAKAKGAHVRAWVVGDGELDLEVPVQRVGVAWPL
jgi:uncharacterized protein (DUF58 family)